MIYRSVLFMFSARGSYEEGKQFLRFSRQLTSSIMNNSKAETKLCQLLENGNSSSSPHLNLKSNSRQDMSIERGRFSSKMSVKRRESLQVYSKRFPQQKKPKSFLMPRTKSLSKNSPIIRRCSLQEDQSILVFQVNYIL